MQVCASCTELQQRDELHERLTVPEVELDSRTNSWEAYAGRLVAEASSLEEDNALLTSQLNDAQADKWYLEIAKAGLEERVAHLAAALVQAKPLCFFSCILLSAKQGLRRTAGQKLHENCRVDDDVWKGCPGQKLHGNCLGNNNDWKFDDVGCCVGGGVVRAA